MYFIPVVKLFVLLFHQLGFWQSELSSWRFCPQGIYCLSLNNAVPNYIRYLINSKTKILILGFSYTKLLKNQTLYFVLPSFMYYQIYDLGRSTDQFFFLNLVFYTVCYRTSKLTGVRKKWCQFISCKSFLIKALDCFHWTFWGKMERKSNNEHNSQDIV